MCCTLCNLARSTQHPARVRAQPRLDRAGAQRAVGRELLDALPAKAKGKPSANAGIVWKFFTTSVYQSGDLPLLATREALQNGVDAIRAAIRHRQIRPDHARFEVTWDPDARSLTWDDNGIGMDAANILDKFLVIGESGKRDTGDSAEAAGGFGVAKAVILGASSTFRWEMHTRDNLAVSTGPSADVEIFDTPARQGTRITIHDVSAEFDHVYDYARRTYVPIAERLRELLAANDLPGVTLRFNGQEVRPMFSRRAGSRVSTDGNWGPGTEVSVKAHRRAPGDRGGAYYLRLGGLFQFKIPSQRGGLKADVVVDLTARARPGAPGYPFNAARDALQDQARWPFQDLVETLERENESLSREPDDEVYDPYADDAASPSDAAELGELVAEAFADPGLQRALSEAVGGIQDFYAERLKHADTEIPVSSQAPAGSRVTVAEAERGPVLPAGFVAIGATPVADDIAAPSSVQVIREFLQSADASGGGETSWEARRDRGIFGPAVELALEQVARGDADAEAVATVELAIEQASEAAMAPGGAGLMQVVAVPRVVAALEKASGEKLRRSPFGRHAGLRIARKTYDRAKAARLKRNYGRWMPHLVVWDGVLRLMAGEARIRQSFKPGFVLDDEVLALTSRSPHGRAVLYIHPDTTPRWLRRIACAPSPSPPTCTAWPRTS